MMHLKSLWNQVGKKFVLSAGLVVFSALSQNADAADSNVRRVPSHPQPPRMRVCDFSKLGSEPTNTAKLTAALAEWEILERELSGVTTRLRDSIKKVRETAAGTSQESTVMFMWLAGLAADLERQKLRAAYPMGACYERALADEALRDRHFSEGVKTAAP